MTEGLLEREPIFTNHPLNFVPPPNAITHTVFGKVIFYDLRLLKNGGREPEVTPGTRRRCAGRFCCDAARVLELGAIVGEHLILSLFHDFSIRWPIAGKGIRGIKAVQSDVLSPSDQLGEEYVGNTVIEIRRSRRSSRIRGTLSVLLPATNWVFGSTPATPSQYRRDHR
jgi:hypothetical protein